MGIDKKSNRNARAGRKQSEYGLQLKEKQKAKFIYGVLEKPFRTSIPHACNARIAASRPEPGPLTITSTEDSIKY
mgnify:CR=1 FL=1